jgi:hypothetical protein
MNMRRRIELAGNDDRSAATVFDTTDGSSHSPGVDGRP